MNSSEPARVDVPVTPARPHAGARRPTSTGRTAISQPRGGGRARSHPLAPEHVGELGAVALLVMGVVGAAFVITGLSIAVEGATIATTYSSSPPPNVAQLGMPQILGGAGIIVAGVLEIVAALLVLLEQPRSRAIAIGLNVLLALVALGGATLIFSAGGGELVLTLTLVITAALLLLSAAALQLRR